MRFGYCTNVHAGSSLAEVQRKLTEFSLPVAQQLQLNTTLPIGLWLSNAVMQELDGAPAQRQFGDWLAEHQLLPYTINGFPFQDFHQPVVKHEVYLPTWAEPKRKDYTFKLAGLLNEILPPGHRGTISTLPIGWPQDTKQRQQLDVEARFSPPDLQTLRIAAEQLATLALDLNRLENETGRWIQVCLEPEPGCLLDCADDMVLFFEQLLIPTALKLKDGLSIERRSEAVKRHIAICHDICHSAVMFESQATAVEIYRRHGIAIGKVQVSSAVEASFGTDAVENQRTWQALEAFAEPKYLHQTSMNTGGDSEPAPARYCGYRRFREDLKDAMSEVIDSGSGQLPADQGWRVHFHVPIFLRQLGVLQTTQQDILAFLKAFDPADNDVHFEIETYAWNVLPDEYWQSAEKSLSTGIAEELRWFEQVAFGSGG